MKRSELRKLEKELRLLAMEETRLDPERDAQMTAWVKEQYELATAEKAKRPIRENKIGRRILLVSATATLLMILSFAYTVFMPNAVSSAKGFVHRATIWINDVLHLQLEIDAPPKEFIQGDSTEAVFYSLEDAATAVSPLALVFLRHPDVELQSITIQHPYQHPKVTMSYRYGSIDFDLLLTNTGDEYSSFSNDFEGQAILWEAGECFYWDLSTFWHAITYYADTEISFNISSELSYDTFAELCQSLSLFN